MRKTLLLVAIAGASYCGYALGTLPTTDGDSIFQTIWDTYSGVVALQLLGFVASASVLIVLAFLRARVIHQEQSIDELHDSVRKAMPWVETLERKHVDVQNLGAELTALDARLLAISNPTTGLSARTRQCQATVDSIRAGLSTLGSDDLVRMIEKITGSVGSAKDRLSAVEEAVASMPELLTTAAQIHVRVGKLADEKDGVLAQLKTLQQKVFELIGDDDSQGTLDELEDGVEDEDGDDLMDQIEKLKSDAGDIADRLDTLDQHVRTIDGVRRDLASIGAKPEDPSALKIVAGTDRAS